MSKGKRPHSTTWCWTPFSVCAITHVGRRLLKKLLSPVVWHLYKKHTLIFTRRSPDQPMEIIPWGAHSDILREMCPFPGDLRPLVQLIWLWHPITFELASSSEINNNWIHSNALERTAVVRAGHGSPGTLIYPDDNGIHDACYASFSRTNCCSPMAPFL